MRVNRLTSQAESAHTATAATPRYWQDAELRLLRRVYPAHGAQYAAHALGRSVYAVTWKAHTLGLTRQSRWQREDDARLERDYPLLGAAHLARELGRTVQSVRYRAWLLGVSGGGGS